MRRHYRLFLATVPLLVLLGLAAAGVASAGGGCHGGDTQPSEASSTVVKIDGCTFAPTVTRIPVGTAVIFENTSQAPHDVTGRMGEWGSNMLASGARWSQRFANAGVYPYSCSLHPGMAGVIVVGSPDLSLASDVQAAPIQTAATTDPAGDATMPIVAAGGLGILGGALVAGGIVSRRRRVD